MDEQGCRILLERMSPPDLQQDADVPDEEEGDRGGYGESFIGHLVEDEGRDDRPAQERDHDLDPQHIQHREPGPLRIVAGEGAGLDEVEADVRDRPGQVRRPDLTIRQGGEEAILEAAAQVLVEEGYDRATTNRIAEVAGVSIGSLYQYFPNKQALLETLFERHIRDVLALLAQHVDALQSPSVASVVRSYVQAMIEMHRRCGDLHRVLVVEALRINGVAALNGYFEQARSLCRDFFMAHAGALRTLDPELASFMLVHAVDGVIDAAVLQPRLLNHPALVDELCELVLRYLGVQGSQAASRVKRSLAPGARAVLRRR